MRFAPNPRLIGAPSEPLYIDRGSKVEIPALLSTYRPLGHEMHSTLSPRTEPIDVRYRRKPKMSEIIFHLVNFYDFFEGREDIVVNDAHFRGRLSAITLQGGGWHIIVHALPSTKKLVQDLAREGGFAITHVGRIVRRRGGAFSMSEGKKILEVLRLFFSFARGTFSGAVLPLGFDETRQRQWGQWGAQHIMYPWHYYEGWFHGQPASLLEDIFPGFLRLCHDAVWQERLRESMYLYLRANSTSGAGVDGGLILAQATLEKMAWIHCVDSKKLYPAQKFSSSAMPARKKIAALLQDLGIPLRIPHKLRTLTSAAKKKSWNGPDALVQVRNEVVHAQQRYPRPPFFEAWRLAQWYIELVILGLAGHSGYYIDRISAHHTRDITKVPWA
jgi:hypothetical protein